jgi:signal transduction histidine kinase
VTKIDERILVDLDHHVNNFLVAMSGHADLLRMRDDEETRVAASTAILDASERMAGLFDDALALLRLTLMPPPLAPEPLEPTGLLEEVAVEIGVDCVVLAPLPQVECDYDQLADLLTQVLRHVRAAIGAGESIAVSAEIRGAVAVLTFGLDGDRAADVPLLALPIATRLAELAGGWLATTSAGICVGLPVAAQGRPGYETLVRGHRAP